MSEFTFFSELDMVSKDGTKQISSEMPAWYNRQMVEELKEDIQMCEFDLKSGRVSESQLPVVRKRLESLNTKMEAIEKSQPKVDDATKDKLNKVRKELGKEISALLFSRSDMRKGLADARTEAMRVETPMIEVSKDCFEIAKACNVTPVNGKISRTQAEKIWKISGRFLGESSNAESLRRD